MAGFKTAACCRWSSRNRPRRHSQSSRRHHGCLYSGVPSDQVCGRDRIQQQLLRTPAESNSENLCRVMFCSSPRALIRIRPSSEFSFTFRDNSFHVASIFPLRRCTPLVSIIRIAILAESGNLIRLCYHLLFSFRICRARSKIPVVRTEQRRNLRVVMKDTLGVLLAGGAGERLYPLTRDRAKPAVTFGGIYRIIDITLSNCLNSDLRRVYILTQYKALSLNRHIREGWNILGREVGEFIEVLPPMKRVSDQWYQGTADAVYQNIYSIGSEQPKHVLILSGDHIYKMDYGKMMKQHTTPAPTSRWPPSRSIPKRLTDSAWSTSTKTAASMASRRSPKITELRSP